MPTSASVWSIVRCRNRVDSSLALALSGAAIVVCGGNDSELVKVCVLMHLCGFVGQSRWTETVAAGSKGRICHGYPGDLL